jgi:hypothetical protein
MNAVIARIGAECEKLPAKFPAAREFGALTHACRQTFTSGYPGINS